MECSIDEMKLPGKSRFQNLLIKGERQRSSGSSRMSIYIYMNEDLQDLQPELVSLQCQTYKGKRIKEVKGNKP